MRFATVAALCAGLAAAPLVAEAATLVLFDGSDQPVAVVVPMAAPPLPSALFARPDLAMADMLGPMRAMEAAFGSAPLGMDPAGLLAAPAPPW